MNHYTTNCPLCNSVPVNAINVLKLSLNGLKAKITCKRTRTKTTSSRAIGRDFKQSGTRRAPYSDIILLSIRKLNYCQSNEANGKSNCRLC